MLRAWLISHPASAPWCTRFCNVGRCFAAPGNIWRTEPSLLSLPSAGIFVNLSVRKPLVIDYKLPYPTGTATGVMINSFFTNGDLAKQQVRFSPELFQPRVIAWRLSSKCSITATDCTSHHARWLAYVPRRYSLWLVSSLTEQLLCS